MSSRPADSIINPEAPLALRLSGQLLLGLVRLYLRRLQFLEEDAGLALRGLARVSRAAAAGLPCLLRHLACQAAGPALARCWQPAPTVSPLVVSRP